MATPEEQYSDSPEVACPWCLALNTDLWEWREGRHSFTCGSCDRPLTLDVRVSITYTLAPLEEDAPASGPGKVEA